MRRTYYPQTPKPNSFKVALNSAMKAGVTRNHSLRESFDHDKIKQTLSKHGFRDLPGGSYEKHVGGNRLTVSIEHGTSNPYWHLKSNGNSHTVGHNHEDLHQTLNAVAYESTLREDHVCPICKGKGNDSKGGPCLTCRGTGQVHDGPSDEPTPTRAIGGGLKSESTEDTPKWAGNEKTVKKTFTIHTSDQEMMDRFERFMAALMYCGNVGHSTTIGCSIDGDGADRFHVSPSSILDGSLQSHRGEYET